MTGGGSTWLLVRGEEILAHLVVMDGDFPWLNAQVQPAAGFDEVRPLFEEELRRLDHLDHDPGPWEAAYYRIWQAVSLLAPDGRRVPEFLLHIDGQHVVAMERRALPHGSRKVRLPDALLCRWPRRIGPIRRASLQGMSHVLAVADTAVPHTQIVRETGRVEIDAAAHSLVWMDDSLYDVAAGWRRFRLDGSVLKARYSGYGPGFDAAVISPAGDLVALLQTSGTKGLILAGDSRLLREVNRSFYHAAAYRYPLALFGLPDGRTGLVHCPDHYNQLEIEDAASGEALTSPADRTPADVFHSRLAISQSGRYLLSAGWVWQPWSCVMVYDLVAALDNPARLDSYGDVFDMRGLIQAEISGACFAGDDVVVSTSPEPNDPNGPDDLAPNMLARWSTTDRQFVWKRQLNQTAGDLLPLADGVLGLYQHPRLYDASTGELAYEWPDLPTGTADSSIVWDKTFSGPARIAIDQRNNRFAVTDGQRITVISWS